MCVYVYDNLLKMSIQKHVLVTKFTDKTYHISQHMNATMYGVRTDLKKKKFSG